MPGYTFAAVLCEVCLLERARVRHAPALLLFFQESLDGFTFDKRQWQERRMRLRSREVNSRFEYPEQGESLIPLAKAIIEEIGASDSKVYQNKDFEYPEAGDSLIPVSEAIGRMLKQAYASEDGFEFPEAGESLLPIARAVITCLKAQKGKPVEYAKFEYKGNEEDLLPVAQKLHAYLKHAYTGTGSAYFFGSNHIRQTSVSFTPYFNQRNILRRGVQTC